MTGTVVQVNVSRGGIPKTPIPAGELTAAGITGDSWRYRFHGGPKQAVQLITLEGIEELAAQGFPLSAGALGENLTTRGLDRRALRFGQRLHVGTAIIELTKTRQPCATLGEGRTSDLKRQRGRWIEAGCAELTGEAAGEECRALGPDYRRRRGDL